MTECLMVLVDFINVDRTFQLGYALINEPKVIEIIARLRPHHGANEGVRTALMCYDGLVERIMSTANI